MPESRRRTVCSSRGRARALLLLAACSLGAASSGCAALTNPVADGIPARRLPPEVLGEPRDQKHTIPLTLLRQPPAEVYRLAADDVLGVYIEGVLGERDRNPPISFPGQLLGLSSRLPPAVGFPIPVRPDGTIALPMIDPIPVQGLSLAEAEKAIRDGYVKKEILKPGRERIIVTLMQPRQTHVLVIRQEAGGFTTAGIGGLISTSAKRGTGNVVDLPAYENDVLNALARTGGLPGLDAYNDVFVFKGSRDSQVLGQELLALPAKCDPMTVAALAGRAVRIPLRLRPDEPPPFRPEDVVLQTGDVVFVEARDLELFYTGGLLPSGEFILPRDHDLDVLEAVARVQGPLVSGAFAGSNQFASGPVVPRGIGGPSPSLLVVLRRTPGGGQVPIRVDLNRALRDPRERIPVKPGDVLILQETPGEALARYFSHNFNFTLISRVIQTNRTTGTITTSTP